MNLYKIPTHKKSPKTVNVIVEIPKGTNAKYEYDGKLEVFTYDRSLTSAMTYPCSYGFIPSTLGEDGDALDFLIYNSTPIERGTLVECRVVGVLDMEDDGEKDYKIVGVPTSHVRKYYGLKNLDPMFLKIAKNFFQHYKDLNNKEVKVLDWHDKEVAYEIINKFNLD
jgi:inorganic pyrophosphatase